MRDAVSAAMRLFVVLPPSSPKYRLVTESYSSAEQLIQSAAAGRADTIDIPGSPVAPPFVSSPLAPSAHLPSRMSHAAAAAAAAAGGRIKSGGARIIDYPSNGSDGSDAIGAEVAAAAVGSVRDGGRSGSSEQLTASDVAQLRAQIRKVTVQQTALMDKVEEFSSMMRRAMEKFEGRLKVIPRAIHCACD